MLFLTLLVEVGLVVDVPVGADELLDAGVVGGQRQKVVQDAQLGRVEEGQARVHLNRDSHFTQNENEKKTFVRTCILNPSLSGSVEASAEKI